MNLTRLGTVKLGCGRLQILSESLHTNTTLSCQTVLQRAEKMTYSTSIKAPFTQDTSFELTKLQLLNSVSSLQYQRRVPSCVLLLYCIMNEFCLAATVTCNTISGNDHYCNTIFIFTAKKKPTLNCDDVIFF